MNNESEWIWKEAAFSEGSDEHDKKASLKTAGPRSGI
jgi:hypothetical protein